MSNDGNKPGAGPSYIRAAERRLERQAEELRKAGMVVSVVDVHQYEMAVGRVAKQIKKDIEG